MFLSVVPISIETANSVEWVRVVVVSFEKRIDRTLYSIRTIDILPDKQSLVMTDFAFEHNLNNVQRDVFPAHE